MSGKTGIGTMFQKKILGAYESIANMTNISGPGSARDIPDTTTFDNDDGFREFISGLRDGGTLSFDMLFTKDGYEKMLDDFNDDAAQEYAIFFAGQGEGAIMFKGLVTDLPLEIPLNDVIKCSVSIKITGEIDIPELGPYLVSYNENGATGGKVPKAQTKLHSVALTLRTNTGTLVKTTKTFDGWNTKADGTGTDYAASASYSGNLVLPLFAKWI